MPKARGFALFFIVMLSALLAPPHFTSAQSSPSAFTIEQILSAPFASDLIAAPTGERIAWVFNQEGKRNLWVAEGPEFKARQLTQFNEDDGQELLSPSFTHDGKWLVYVRGGEENQAGEVPNPTQAPYGAEQVILATHWDTGRTVKVGYGTEPLVHPAQEAVLFERGGQLWLNAIGADVKKAQPMFIARGNNSAAQWSPDGKQLAFVSNRNDHSFIGVYDIAAEKLRYLAPTLDRDSYPRWSPDGKKLAFVRQPTRGTERRSLTEERPDPWAIWQAEGTPLKAKEIWHSSKEGVEDSLPRWAGNDVIQWVIDDRSQFERILFRSERYGWMRLHLTEYPAVSDANSIYEARVLTSHSCEVEQLTISPDRRMVAFTSNCGDINRRHIELISIDPAPKAKLSGKAMQWSPVFTGNGKWLAFIQAEDRQPAQIRLLKLDAQAVPNRLAPNAALLENSQPSSTNTDLDKTITLPKTSSDALFEKLVSPQPVTFKAADGLDIHGQLFLPPNAKPGEKLPAVIFSHGGPMRQMLLGWHPMFYYHNTYAFNQFLASRGYAVLSVNYRGGIGYGRAFREAPKRGGRGAAEYQDIVAGAQFLRSRADIDTNRIGLWGGSYGGFLTALGLARNSDLFAAGVDIHGVHDWASRITGGEASDRDAAKIARESSPMFNVEKWRSPVLLIHGDDDRNVAFNQSTELARRLREQKVEFEQLVFPDEVHDFLLHRTWVEVFKASFDFLERHLKNAKPRQTSWKVQPSTQRQIDVRYDEAAERAFGVPPSGGKPGTRNNRLKAELQTRKPRGTVSLNESPTTSNFTPINLPLSVEKKGRFGFDAWRVGKPITMPLQSNAGFQSATQPIRVDILIRNGRVLDGSGANETRADIGITGDRITFVGNASRVKITATRTVDAAGLIVAPGFIDPHTHADEDLTNAQRKSNVNYLMQGVTTVVIGSDGRSPLPVSKRLEQLNAQGIGTNAIQLVGHGSVRGAVLGAADVAPTTEQLEKMKALVKQAMEDGAFGMSTGLYYAPGSFAKTEEVIELSKVVAAHGGIYDSHIRDESSYTIGLLGSIEEVIRIGREAKLPVHVSHIKALGVDVWGKSKDVIELIEKARAAGVQITANQYPYTASGTSVTASLVPRWAEAGGTAELLKRLDDPAIRPRLVKEMEENMRRRGGANSLLITSGRNRAWVGKRLDEIAKAAGKSPIETAIDIIKAGGAAVASFNMNEQDIEAFMKQPWVMTGSDGSGGHPRKYGTYPRKLSDYVRKRGVISLPRFIQASSAQVAETFGVKERGALRTGYFADVVIFDEKTVAETATYEQPEKLATGMKYVFVNGKLAVEEGKYTGALAGQALRKTGKAH